MLVKDVPLIVDPIHARCLRLVNSEIADIPHGKRWFIRKTAVKCVKPGDLVYFVDPDSVSHFGGMDWLCIKYCGYFSGHETFDAEHLAETSDKHFMNKDALRLYLGKSKNSHAWKFETVLKLSNVIYTAAAARSGGTWHTGTGYAVPPLDILPDRADVPAGGGVPYHDGEGEDAALDAPAAAHDPLGVVLDADADHVLGAVEADGRASDPDDVHAASAEPASPTSTSASEMDDIQPPSPQNLGSDLEQPEPLSISLPSASSTPLAAPHADSASTSPTPLAAPPAERASGAEVGDGWSEIMATPPSSMFSSSPPPGALEPHDDACNLSGLAVPTPTSIAPATPPCATPPVSSPVRKWKHDAMTTPLPTPTVPSSPIRARVETIHDALHFTGDFLTSLKKCFPEHPAILAHLADRLSSCTTSTCFSGIDSPGTADQLLAGALSDELGEPVPAPRHLAACELDQECVRELLAHPSKPEHIFSDVRGFMKPALLEQIRREQARGNIVSLGSLAPVVASGLAAQKTGWCTVHSRMCTYPTATLHTSGPPCPDWSRMTKGRPRGDGKTAIAIAAWAGLVLATEPDIVLVEEAPDIDQELLSVMFGHIYRQDHAILCPSAFGGLCRRERYWGTYFHHKFIHTVYASLSLIIPVFSRTGLVPWWALVDFMSSDEVNTFEQQEVAVWCSQRRSSAALGMSPEALLATEYPCETALSVNERKWVKRYNEILPDGIHNLNQNPFSAHAISSKTNAWGIPIMYTILHSTTLHWSSRHRRLLTGSEMLLAMGFPIRSDMAPTQNGTPRRCCSHCPAIGEDPQAAAKSRTLRTRLSQAGNSQHVAINAFLKVYVLMFSVRVDKMPFVSALSVCNRH
jgi:hypothetical protein